MDAKRIKVLMCCLGPETHNRGIIVVSTILKEEGMEVVYMGNTTAENAIKAAMEEDVQIIGVSSLSGAHLRTGKHLLELATKKGIAKSMAFVIGGVIPPNDVKILKDMGFYDVCVSGTKRDELITVIKNAANIL
ncbi:cobalamin B12-binding domain-containing protein [Desulfosporosinus nitroreducens]|uniref:cobalamin B12-binding domain-containing protein n=1 Tax=Desulfosporosinus nitroreducens TaxID=2018668 RepID=UPI00207C45F1|nr:cobalamin-dependent protein [Desulfosporosinus nitroreducens]MCO1604311.1 cobalamin-dependent protein [Desulfosporosinus nitroreducens]